MGRITLFRVRPENAKLLSYFASVAVCSLVSLPSFAALSDTALSTKINAAKILPKGVTYRILRVNEHLRVDISHYPTLNARTRKIDSLLITRAILNADPGGIDTVVVRFSNDSDAGSYFDLVVSNRDIVGADAGIVGTDELLSGIEEVSIRRNDSDEESFNKYCIAAENELRKQDFREAENFFQMAHNLSPDAAKKNVKYLAGLVQLARGYSGREDTADEERVYRAALASLPDKAGSDTLNAVREIFQHYFRKEDYASAEPIAQALVKLQSGTDTPRSVQYADDLQQLAACHRRLGRLNDAKKEYEETLMLKRNLLGENHPSMAATLEGLGDCYADEKNTATACDFFKQAKVAYDHAVFTKDIKYRISYEVYRSIVRRLDDKMGKKRI